MKMRSLLLVAALLIASLGSGSSTHTTTPRPFRALTALAKPTTATTATATTATTPPPPTPWICDDITGIKSRIAQVLQGKKYVPTTETAPCDPVDCVLYTAATDPGVFGPCVEELTGWFKSKTLGILTPAKYGGVCAPVRVNALCPPVACVLNAPLRDMDYGPFGPCQQEADGWFKYRVLKIKTPAQYGGTPCPPEAERRDRMACVRTYTMLAPGLSAQAAITYASFGINLSYANAYECYRACRGDPRCLSFRFYLPTKYCFLLSQMTGTVVDANYASGTMNNVYE